jgi:eukaryotic-like serine/threonine-protein kinase
MGDLRRIGRYELLAPIEAGLHLGRLRGAAGFEKLVLVRVFDRAAPGLVEEARRASAIKHPSVIDILDVGEDMGRIFVAVDELEGASLRQTLAHGRLDELDAARIIATAAEALDAAHDLRLATGEPAGFAHGHLTADSIVVLYNGRIKLGDFGVRSSSSLATTAPERLGGAPADRRSDYFSLGAVMWQALTGEPLVAGTDDEIKQAITTLDVRPPSSVNANVPVALDEIVARALHRDPAARYATGAELANDLEDVLAEAGYPRRNERIERHMTTAFAERIAARHAVMADLAANRTPSTAAIAAAYGTPAPVGRTTTTVASVPPPISTPSPLVAAPAPLVPAPPILPPSATQVGRAISDPIPEKPAEKPAAFATTTMGRPAAEPEPATPVEPPAGTFVALKPAVAETIELPKVAEPVSLPKRPARADSTGEQDVLGKWAWQSGSHTAITDDDDEYEHEGKRRRKTLIYATGAGVAVAAIVAILALAFGGDDDGKHKKQIAASDPPEAAPLPTERQTQRDTVPPDPATEAVLAAVADARLELDAAIDNIRAEHERLAAEKAAADEAAAAKAAADADADAQRVAAEQAAAELAAANQAKAKAAAEKAAADLAAAQKAEAKRVAKAEKSKSRGKRAKTTTAVPIDPYADPAPAPTAAPKKPTVAEAELAYRNGVQLFARGDPNGALTALKTSQLGNPGHAPTQRALGLVYEKLGRPDLAKAAFKRYLKLAPKAQDAAIIRARIDKL